MHSEPALDGETYDAARDGKRLFRQLRNVRACMESGRWLTLDAIRRTLSDDGVPASIASVSARIRDLRKPRFGGAVVERRYVSRGLWEYRLVKPAGPATQPGLFAAGGPA